MGRLEKLPDAVAEVLITGELLSRQPLLPDHGREKLALEDLALHMVERPEAILPRLVNLAMEHCGADSAGISVLDHEAGRFRWVGLQGTLAAFEGATTPRDDSPCGVCLDQRGPLLMAHPERAYSWIRDANIVVPEVLLVPLLVKDQLPLGTLWVVAKEGQFFNTGHSESLAVLARFTGMALHMIQTEENLRKALEEQETLSREMSHRVKNLFSVAQSLVRFSARSAKNKEELEQNLTGRFTALSEAHSLVRKSFSNTEAPKGVGLETLVGRILRPYAAHIVIRGPDVAVGETATNNLALVLHELATNAAKYGALMRDGGGLFVGWTLASDILQLSWKETGGPLTSAPLQSGFGTKMIKTSLATLNGTIDYVWDGPSGVEAKISIPTASLAK